MLPRVRAIAACAPENVTSGATLKVTTVQRFVRLAGRIEATKFRGILTLTWLLFAGHVRAAGGPTCGAETSPWISVEFAGRGWQERARAEVIADLRAGLRQESIDVCPRDAGPKSAPLAAITLRLADRTNLSV